MIVCGIPISIDDALKLIGMIEDNEIELKIKQNTPYVLVEDIEDVVLQSDI